VLSTDANHFGFTKPSTIKLLVVMMQYCSWSGFAAS